MAGFRTFATGEVLTAANVNSFLMKQSVMVFADAAARTAALGAEVAEGMLTYNEDTAQLEVFDGSAFVVAAPAPPAGIGSNVVSTTRTTTFSASVAGVSFSTNAIEVTITPSSDTSRILVVASLAVGGPNSNTGFRLVRGASAIGVGDADGSRPQMTGDSPNPTSTAASNPNGRMLLDSPGVDTAVTYGVQLFNIELSARTLFLNRNNSDGNDRTGGRLISTLTAIEVAA